MASILPGSSAEGAGRKMPPKKKASVWPGGLLHLPGGWRWRHGRAVSEVHAVGTSRSALLPFIVEAKHFPFSGLWFSNLGDFSGFQTFYSSAELFPLQVKAYRPAKAEGSSVGWRWGAERQAHPLSLPWSCSPSGTFWASGSSVKITEFQKLQTFSFWLSAD